MQENINRAFSKQSTSFDEYDKNNPILQWMRLQIHKHVMAYTKAGQKMLELNAGTGIDAVFFAQQGIHIHATDVSDGMIEVLRTKVNALNLNDHITIQQCSYTDLDKIQFKKFDYIFSDFGGLNCASDLSPVIGNFNSLLKPGAMVSLVLMPPVCPWEMLSLFKGNFNLAFRRFKKQGTLSHLEGECFKTYYYKPSQILKLFGTDYRLVKLQGLASWSPPPYKDKFPLQFPGVYKMLTSVEEKLSGKFPFNSWADHFILTVQYLPDR